MITRIANIPFFRETVIAGVYINIHSEDSLQCQYVVLEKKKGSVQIIQKGEASLDKLNEGLSAKIPLKLIVDGKGVLQRECKAGLSDEQLILQAFPNVNPSEYYVQAIEQEQSSNLACFARKNIVDDIVSKLKAQSFSILDLSLGALPLRDIVALKENGKLIAYPYSILIKDAEIQQIEKIQDTEIAFTLVGEESIPVKQVLPFATAFGYFAQTNLLSFRSEVVQTALLDYSYQRIMKKGGILFLIFLFIGLLVNFLIFTSQRETQQQLSDELGLYQATAQELNSIKQEIAEKEKLTDNGSQGVNTYFSYYADRIAASKPDGIILQKMHIVPLTLKNKKFDLVGVQKDTVFIQGVTRNSILLNEWTNNLQSQKFIQHVSITNYTQVEQSIGNFTLVIALKKNKE